MKEEVSAQSASWGESAGRKSLYTDSNLKPLDSSLPSQPEAMPLFLLILSGVDLNLSGRE